MDTCRRLHYNAGMNLSDDEKRDAAMACRLAMVQAEKDRDAQISPTVKQQLQRSVDNFSRLAERFERERVRPGSGR